MTRPRLTVYNEISIDGRIGGFAQDPIRYYRRGFRWRSDAILMGSVTARSFGPAESSHEQSLVLPPPDKLPIVGGFEDLVYDPRPLSSTGFMEVIKPGGTADGGTTEVSG